MAAPTYVAEHESPWNNSLPITLPTTTVVGNVLAAFGGIHNGSAQLNLPSGGGLTWTQQQYRKPSTSYCTGYLWSATATANSSFDTSLTKVATDSSLMGMSILRFSGSNGIGASAANSASSATPTLSLTTTQANSAIVMLVLDWNAVPGARTYRTSDAGAFTETTSYIAGTWTVHGGYYPNAGAAGEKTLGVSAPAGQKYTILAMEVLGTPTGDSVTPVFYVSGGQLVPMVASLV